MKLLVTGAAGFIGMHSCKRLIERGHEVFGIDNLNSYYDPTLKQARLEQLRPSEKFTFEKLDIFTQHAPGPWHCRPRHPAPICRNG